MGGYKTCTICGEEKEKTKFYSQRRQCIPCYNKRQSEKTANASDLYERMIRLDSRFDQMDEKMTAILDMVNKLCIKSETHRRGGIYDKDETGYHEVKQSTCNCKPIVMSKK